ncbi:helix-turn-helix domain-containing protein [Streptomyces sp. t39]|uniref:helix-turn-helix domain-containing protein n=1 Tax=Streptomyces sp. t39 TaxID=1828156 RepID=UPI0021C7F8B0|nr:helix-turn-helix domain-containing protein [Streptomyces sp. t39]
MPSPADSRTAYRASWARKRSPGSRRRQPSPFSTRAEARAALRFAAAGPPGGAVADHDELGPVALLADIPVERLRAQADVRRLAALVDGGRGGQGGELLAALAAFCRTGTLRQAAAELHLHHSSVAARLARVEKGLGWRLRDPGDRFRAQLALYAVRLSAGDGTGGA